MTLYHITKEKHLPSILIEGLKVNSGKTGFCKKEVHKDYKFLYEMQPIFLTNDIEFISKTMLTDEWIKKNKPIILRVNIELNNTNSSMGLFKDSVDGIELKEFRYFLNISPCNIEVVSRVISI